MPETEKKFRKIGSLWKNTRSSSKAILSGEILNEDGMRLRVIVVNNDYKREGSKEPDYRVLSADDWEIDEYSRRQKTKETQHKDPETVEEDPLNIDEIPF